MASVEAFKSAIVRIRDIFRGLTPSITGMESMRHVCLYLLSRFITKKKVKSLDVPDAFAWENLIEMTHTTNGGVQKALDYFYHKETDCLVNHFDRLFGTRDFAFDIKNPVKHKEILDILSNKDIDFEKIDLNMDILGWVYEQHLGKGSGGNAMRDLGQFFTDRFICDYMVNLCKPSFKSKGVPESVCDPSMGTGGFLTSYMKFYKKQHADKPIDWSIQNKEIYGCDTDQKVAGVARLNLFMESGGNVANNLLLRNSLNEDLLQTGYDIILANMPFGLKGLKYTDCCKRVRDLIIRGTKSEPLFLQLMMVSLNRGGRCAVVVPDGMLVNISSCHNETRKYLLDNFDLKRVIKMKGQFFINTGIQPSILFFENTGKPTSAVEFWDVIRGTNGDIEETMMLSVPREKFDASYSFDMRRYQEVKAVVNPAGFPMVKLGDILTDHPVKNPVATTHADGGVFSLYSSSCDVFKHSITEFSGKPYLLQGSRGTISKATHYCDMPFSASNNVFVLSATDSSNVSLKFIYYFLRLSSIADQTATTSVIPMLTKTMFREIKMPLPPLEIQQEIVAILDRNYDSVKSSKDTIECLQSVMKSLIGTISRHTVITKEICDAFDVMSGKGNYVQDVDGYPYYDSNGITGKRKDFLYDGEHIVTARKMSIGSVHYVKGKYWPSDNTINLSIKPDNKDVMIKLVYYWLFLNNDILKNLSSGIKPGIRKTDVEKIKIPVPSLEFQEQIINRLDALQSQISAFEETIKNSEDNARFILNSYVNL